MLDMEFEKVSPLTPEDTAPAGTELDPGVGTLDPLEFDQVLEAYRNGSITPEQEMKLVDWVIALDDGLLSPEEGEKLARVYYGPLFKDVDNCRSLQRNRWSVEPQVEEATDHILAELAELPKGIGNQRQTKRCLKVVLLNLLHVHLVDEERWVRYSRDAQYYRHDGNHRYNPLGIGRNAMVRVMNALRSLKYVEYVLHYKPIATETKGRQSRVRATAKLISLLHDRFQIKPHMIGEFKSLEPIRLKDKDGHLCGYRETPETKQMRSRIEDYNALIARTEISLQKCEKVEHLRKARPIDFTRTRYFRTFEKGSFNLGGRYYGHWAQDMKKELRPYLTINGNPTVELDFGSMFVHLAYCLEGVCYRDSFGDEDPYYLPQMPDLKRKISKSVLLISFNNVSETTLLKAVGKDLRERRIYYGDVDLKEVFAAHREKHFRINNKILTKFGSELTYLESKVSQAVIDKMNEAGIAALNVHDSFIVAEKHEETLRECMTEVWRGLGLTSVPNVRKA